MSSPLVAVSHVSFGYGGPPVLSDVDCTIEAGQFTGIVGPSGSGKTSLLKVLLGTVTPQHGSVKRFLHATLRAAPVGW